MPFDKNSQDATWARLADESAAAKLLGQGCVLMSRQMPLSGKDDPVIMLWTMGVERMLMLFISLCEFDQTGRRPIFVNGSNNSVVRLEDSLFAHIEKWIEKGPGWESYPGKIYGAVSESVYWRELLVILNDHLRAVRSNPEEVIARVLRQDGEWVSPREKLASFHSKLFSEPHMMDRYSPTMPLLEFNLLANEVDQRISCLVLDWWFMLTKLAGFGAFGELAKKIGPRLAPGRLSDGAVAPLSKVRLLRLYSTE